MAVPTQLSDLSATAASNSPAGSDAVGTTMDDFFRAHASIIARISDGTDAMATPRVTSLNKISFTQPATGATVTIADGKTLTVSKTLTLTGTDGTTHTLPATSATLARTDAAQTFTGDQRINGIIGVGAAPISTSAVHVGGTITYAASAKGYSSAGAVDPSAVSTEYSAYFSNPSVSAGTLPDLAHFYASVGTYTGTVTRQYGFLATSAMTNAGTNYGFYGAIPAASGRYNFYAAGTADNYFAGTISSLGSYNATTAVSANMAIASDGAITRATSSLRYKTDVETLDSARADAVVLGSRPVWYRSTCDNDNHSWGWYGLIAEELAEIDPRLVHWGRPSKEVEIPATDTEPATVTNVEDTSAPLRPEGVMYDRLTVMLLDVVKRQQAQIDSLTARVEALEA